MNSHALHIHERPARQPFHIMVKPAGSKCNLDCAYCFYLEKEVLFKQGKAWKMDDALLQNYVRRYIEAQPSDPVVFAWQGGEPTLAGLDFFRKAVHWQKEYGAGRTIENAFQTNGTLLNDDWASFFSDENFLIGISIDGPAHIHDHYRVAGNGSGSHDKVMRGLDFLKKHRVEFNTLTCVHAGNSGEGAMVYRYLRKIGSRHMQFIPIVERTPDTEARQLGLTHATPPALPQADADGTEVTRWSVRPKAYGRFLWDIFKYWVQHDVGKVYVQFFENALGKWLRMPGGVCVFNEECGRALALEHDGSVYSCDHYVYPGFRLGQLDDGSLADMADGVFQTGFGRAKYATLPEYCKQCDYRFACNGGCPKQRFIETPDGAAGLNYLCAGYKFIFSKMAPYMEALAMLVQRQQPPAHIMQMIRRKHLPKPI